jgi:hypothetical protein
MRFPSRSKEEGQRVWTVKSPIFIYRTNISKEFVAKKSNCVTKRFSKRIPRWEPSSTSRCSKKRLERSWELDIALVSIIHHKRCHRA